jgi:hypothetical protein
VAVLTPLSEDQLDRSRSQRRDYLSERLAQWDAMYGRYSDNPKPEPDEVAAIRAELSGRV